MPAQQHSRDAAAAPERVKPPVAKAAVEERQYSNTKSLPFEHSTVSLPDNSALPLTPLTLPGKTADKVIAIDQHSGTVRQVFFQGTPQEVTIIQRIAVGNSPETAASSRLQSGAG